MTLASELSFFCCDGKSTIESLTYIYTISLLAECLLSAAVVLTTGLPQPTMSCLYRLYRCKAFLLGSVSAWLDKQLFVACRRSLTVLLNFQDQPFYCLHMACRHILFLLGCFKYENVFQYDHMRMPISISLASCWKWMSLP